ncbi:MAG TPA: BTAD domain-containing putative transcriptional regulator [Streptosporangiaceae bacterium]|jgi:predicted ATPase
MALHISVLGPVTVSGQDAVVAGQALGGRRARVALVALALSGGPVPAERLAALIWAGEAPPTWPAALRGVIRGLRAALAGIGGGGQQVITTTPVGYGLAAGVTVDMRDLAQTLRAAQGLADQGRHQAVLDALVPLAAAAGEQLLPGEEDAWLEPRRREIDEAALRAQDMMAAAASELGDHHRATSVARRAVAAHPLDERAHRALIRTLHRAGDRAGVVLAFDECRSLLADQLGVDPDPETVAAYLAALGEQEPAGVARLPAVRSAFFGREPELARLTDAIAAPGLVTVAGRGGVGKSRLVIQAASRGPALPGGRLWVPLTAVGQDELVASSVAMTLGVSPGADDVTVQLTGRLAPLGRALLILDGCESVVDGVASLAAGLLASCPLLSVIVTSRVPLSVEGERVLRLDPLPVPQAGGRVALAASPQVRLLADRVREGGGRLDLDDAAAPFVAELCRRCGGLPLALELVAAQLPEMSVADLLDHLPEVSGDDRLRAVARSSYELLDADEARVFRLFGVLDGAVPLPLVRQVAAAAAIAPVRVVRILRELTSRGLLLADRSGPRWRYQQDDDLHAFARELLAEAGEEHAALSRLADAVAAVLPADPRATPAPYLEPIGELQASVRLLLGAAIDGRLSRERGLEMGFRLHRYWAATDVTEGRFWLSRLLAGQPRMPWTGRATYAAGYLDYWAGDSELAVRELQTAVDLLGDADEPDEYAARALIYLGGLADDQDLGAKALSFVRRSISAAAPFGVDLQVGAAIGLGCVLAERADPEAARHAADAIELCRRGGSAEQLAATLPTAAMVCWQVGDLAAAVGYIAEAQPLLAGTRRIARVVLQTAAAGVALAQGDAGAAIELGTSAAGDASDLGIAREQPLPSAIVARAWLERGDVAAAAQHALAAVTAARSLAFAFPLAVALETTALIVLAGGRAAPDGPAASPAARPSPAASASARTASARTASARSAAARPAPELADQLLEAAAAIRVRGDRPVPPTLRAAVSRAAALVAGSGGDAAPLSPAAAAALAVAVLTDGARQHQEQGDTASSV